LLQIHGSPQKSENRAKTNKKQGKAKVLENRFNAVVNGTTIAGNVGVF
jgi:hypothetical protein